MAIKKAIEKYLSQKTLAVVGISRNEKKFGNLAYKELQSKGYTLYPVHPEMETYNGQACYPSLSKLPEKVGGVLISVSPPKTAAIVKEAEELGIENIWIQQRSESEEAISLCKQKGLNAIYQECILMYAKPVGFPHSIHRWLRSLFGKLPK